MTSESLSLEDAFAELIKKRKWYAASPSPLMAKKDKYNFERGIKIPEHRLRQYLIDFGAECVQEELWRLKENI